jgi:exopolysaccharide biosynthesis polyprenyl glycosylphosphotransferase
VSGTDSTPDVLRPAAEPLNVGPTTDPAPPPPILDRPTDGGAKVWRARLRTSRLLELLRVGPCLLLGDLAALLGAGALTSARLAPGLTTMALVLISYRAGRLYRPRLTLSVLDDLPALAARAFAVTALVVAGEMVLPVPPAYELFRTVVVGLVLLVLARGTSYALIREARRRRLIAHRTLVVGDCRVGRSLASHMRHHPDYGLLPVGYLSDAPPAGDGSDVPLLGTVKELARVVGEQNIAVVVLAFVRSPSDRLVACLRTCDRLQCDIFWVPRLFELTSVEAHMDTVWGYPLVRRRREIFSISGHLLKRCFDLAVAGVALVAALPAMLVCALAIRLESGRDVLFRQERVGVDGRPFTLLKFRSLRPATDEEQQTRWSVAHDDRLGPVGRFLRKSSLDELPQIWNILRGDMSLVGPRPERPLFVARFRDTYPRYADRHRVRGGLTGWAQIHGLRGDTSIADRARFDNQYIENWSLWGDTKIVLRTVIALFRHRGA